MCLIIANPTCANVPNEYIINAFSQNSDGFGVMYSKYGVLRVKRGLFTIANVLQIFAELEAEQVPYVAHFRYATHGTMNSANCHPFPIANNLGGIAMVHNGTLTGKEWYSSTRSDTALLANKISKHIERKHIKPRDLFEQDVPFVADKYGESIGTDKLVFMNGKGEINIYNENNGLWMDDVWYSNLYSLCSTRVRYGSWSRGTWTSKVTEEAPAVSPTKAEKLVAE